LSNVNIVLDIQLITKITRDPWLINIGSIANGLNISILYLLHKLRVSKLCLGEFDSV